MGDAITASPIIPSLSGTRYMLVVFSFCFLSFLLFPPVSFSLSLLSLLQRNVWVLFFAMFALWIVSLHSAKS